MITSPAEASTCPTPLHERCAPKAITPTPNWSCESVVPCPIMPYSIAKGSQQRYRLEGSPQVGRRSPGSEGRVGGPAQTRVQTGACPKNFAIFQAGQEAVRFRPRFRAVLPRARGYPPGARPGAPDRKSVVEGERGDRAGA